MWISLLAFAGVHSSAQTKLTFRTCYDFNIGDVFQWEGRNNVTIGPPVYVKKTITAKSMSAASDTIYYWADKRVYACQCPPTVYATSFEKDSFFITNLDSPVFGSASPDVSTDTFSRSSRDSVIVSAAYHNRSINWRIYAEHAKGKDSSNLSGFRDIMDTMVYGEGLGSVFSYHLDLNESNPDGYSNRLIYYKKGTEEYGALVSVEPDALPVSSFRIYPNPATDFIGVETAAGNYAYEIFEMHGQLVDANTGYSGSLIHTSGLSPGIYFLKITTRDKIQTSRFVIE